MQFQNSYIFIPNPYNKKEFLKKQENGVIYVEVGIGFVSRLEKIFHIIKKVPESKSFFKVYTVDLDRNSAEVKFFIHEVVKNYYLDVVVTGKSKVQIVKVLEYIQETIEKSNLSKDYIEIISYDAISKYYCDKIYPKLNELERNLRKLLFNIYVVNFGLNYYQTTISNSLQNKIKGVIRAKGCEKRKEIENLQKFFYSMEFSDIQEMLFVPHWTDMDEKAKDNFLRNHKDLSKLTDDELRRVFSGIAPKSDWDRFFADKMDDANIIQSLIDEIRKSRNNIAHCKFFYQVEYITCNKNIGKFNKAVKSAIAITEAKDFSDKNSESIKKALASVTKLYEEFTQSLSESIVQIIPDLLKDYINPINASPSLLQYSKHDNDKSSAYGKNCKSNKNKEDSTI